MIFSIYNDHKKYAYIGFDWKQIVQEFGESMDTRFDVNCEAKPYSAIWKNPIKVNFSDNSEGMTGTGIPEIAEHQGRLFLSQKAYEILRDLLEKDGEFLPVEYENGQGFIFNPLSLAEAVDGIDNKLSVKNEWGEVENIAFHNDKVKNLQIFKSNFDAHYNVFCQESVKNAVEKSGLKGVIFTPDLGNNLGIYGNETN